jgi:hypothetical protein
LYIPEYASFAITVLSAFAASTVAYYFFRFYRISGIGYFLGMPVGFSFLAVAHAFFAASIWIDASTRLHNVFAWMSLITLSYSFSMIAMSYYYRSAEFNERTRLIKIMSLALIPVIALLAAVELTSLEQKLISFQVIDEYFVGFNLAALGYVFAQCLNGIRTGEKPKMYYIPAGFALLWIAQLSVLLWALYGSGVAASASFVAGLAGPILFVYALHRAMTRGGRIAETTKT